MQILISCLAFDEGKSGISDYIVSVCREMIVEHQVTLLIHPSDKAIFPLKSPNLRYIRIPEWIKRSAISMFWHLFVLPYSIDFKPYDLVFLPAGNRRLMAKYPKNTAVTFHDLSQFHIAAKYDGFRMFYIKHVIPYFLRTAPRIYAISENTKKDMVLYYRLPPNRIQINYNGYSPEKLSNSTGIEELRKGLNLNKKYILYVARIEHPGKNHLNLIKAYALLPAEIRDEYDLVCAGGFWNGSDKVFAYAGQLECFKSIHFTGFVSNADMAALYLNASLYVFPSLYEGFGIPMLEAFAAGIPVVCANRSSLPEIGLDAVISFDPEKPEMMAKDMLTVLKDPGLAQEMVRKGRERLAAFSWKKHTNTILNSFR